MSREIKFRAFYEGRMYSVASIIFTEQMVYIKGDSDVGGFGAPLEDILLMQFTGLTDKNGKEIYEGDILRFREKLHTVEWNNRSVGLILREAPNRLNTEWGQWTRDLLEVIGSKYENPELLTV